MIYTKEASRIENNYKVFTGLTHKGNCIYCGDEFMSRSIAAKYCSQRCKNDKQINQRAEMILEKKRTANNCIVCNNPIKQNPRGKIKKYCSNKCKQKNYRIKPGHVKITWNNIKSCDTKPGQAGAPMDIPHISTH